MEDKNPKSRSWPLLFAAIAWAFGLCALAGISQGGLTFVLVFAVISICAAIASIFTIFSTRPQTRVRDVIGFVLGLILLALVSVFYFARNWHVP